MNPIDSAVRLGTSYADFAEKEAAGRSPLYAEFCRGIADDSALLEKLAQLPLEKQQPNLLLAAVKYLFGVARDYPHFRALVTEHWDRIIAVVMSRRTQTNEPARCATLLPLLALLPRPLALLEVGASAGLCLLPDHYAYDYGGRQIAPSVTVESPPLFHCAANAETPVPNRNIEIAWRAGLDLSPLDPANPDDAAWLRALVWPGEGERAGLLDQALDGGGRAIRCASCVATCAMICRRSRPRRPATRPWWCSIPRCWPMCAIRRNGAPLARRSRLAAPSGSAMKALRCGMSPICRSVSRAALCCP